MNKFNPEIWLPERKKFNAANWQINAETRGNCKKFAENSVQKNIENDVEIIISRIEMQKIDLTQSRSEWVKLAFIFSASFAETGRKFFHRISKFYPGYSQMETDKLYDDCMKRKKFENIRSFFVMARNAGIDIRV